MQKLQERIRLDGKHLGRGILKVDAFLNQQVDPPLMIEIGQELAGRLLRLYQTNRLEEWRWFERSLSYCNAALSHALLICGRSIPNSVMTDANGISTAIKNAVNGAVQGPVK